MEPAGLPSDPDAPGCPVRSRRRGVPPQRRPARGGRRPRPRPRADQRPLAGAGRRRPRPRHRCRSLTFARNMGLARQSVQRVVDGHARRRAGPARAQSPSPPRPSGGDDPGRRGRLRAGDGAQGPLGGRADRGAAARRHRGRRHAPAHPPAADRAPPPTESPPSRQPHDGRPRNDPHRHVPGHRRRRHRGRSRPDRPDDGLRPAPPRRVVPAPRAAHGDQGVFARQQPVGAGRRSCSPASACATPSPRTPTRSTPSTSSSTARPRPRSRSPTSPAVPGGPLQRAGRDRADADLRLRGARRPARPGAAR